MEAPIDPLTYSPPSKGKEAGPAKNTQTASLSSGDGMEAPIDPLTYIPPRDNLTKEARRKEKARIAAIHEKYVEQKMHQYIIERMGINTRYSDLDMGGLEWSSFRQEKQSETEHEVEGMNLKEFMTSGNGKEAGSSGQPIKKKPKVSVPDSYKAEEKAEKEAKKKGTTEAWAKGK